MVCPVCNVEAVVTESHYVYSKDEEKLYRAIKYSCRNKKCEKFGKDIGEARQELDVATE